MRSDSARESTGFFTVQMDGLTLSGHFGDVLSTVFCEGGQVCASGGGDRRIIVWDLSNDVYTDFIPMVGHRRGVVALQWHGLTRSVVSGAMDCSVRIWDISAVCCKLTMRLSSAVTCCSVGGTSFCVAVASVGGELNIFDMRMKRITNSFCDGYPTTSAVWSGDGNMLFVGNLRGEIGVIDVRCWKNIGEMRGHSDLVSCLRISPDGSHMISNSADNTLQV